jgi:MtN3 and saliva related transmembrane protein
MIHPDIIGSVAAFCTTVCFIPQAIKLIRTRHTEGVSLLMYIVFTIGVAFWLAYGVLLGRPPMIIANAITLMLTCAILYILIQEKRKP